MTENTENRKSELLKQFCQACEKGDVEFLKKHLHNDELDINGHYDVSSANVFHSYRSFLVMGLFFNSLVHFYARHL